MSILINLHHPHILQLKGFCLNPLSLILEFAPMKSLDRILAEYKRAGSRLDPYVLQKCVVQVRLTVYNINYTLHYTAQSLLPIGLVNANT